ncbi:agmatine deiminase family protein [Brumimicrobium mesophilum]|uniref:agmatine deiminase family protein n=1 Tax=Brumimicrobium mesophilum TaxID=392717 RepID=UPI000D14411A|nr:agmatine deiminase family protein [Brumimicrobium mesophilum]
MKYFLLVALFCSFIGLHAQEEPLPRWLTDDEKEQMTTYQFSDYAPQRGSTTPPNGNLRTMAEWEEIEYLTITWVPNYSNTLTGIVAAAVNECKVLIITPNEANVELTLQNAGVSTTNVEYLDRNYNSIWMRDYAANTVYQDWNDSRILVDWIYNRPRPLDNGAPEAYANFLNIPIYQMTSSPTDVIATGGNYMSDGFGTSISSKLIIDENAIGNNFGVTPKTDQELNSIFNSFMGIDNYIKVERLPYDDIDHIDMQIKFLDEETLLVTEYPMGTADGPQIEANLQYLLSNFTSVYGTPYRVIRIVVPPSTSGYYPDNNGYYRTYANQVFVNNTVIVPFYREEYDTIAQRVLEEAMPGYNIVGVNVDGENGETLIASGGAIHCITHSVGVEDPLMISHQRLRDTYDNTNPYEVTAYISHRSGIQSATLYYKIGQNGTYQSISMTDIGGEDWQANIPAQTGELEVFYYIEAESNSGKSITRPMPAPTGYWKFTVFDAGDVGLDNEEIESLKVYPNPATSITVIPVKANAGESGVIELVDATGRRVELIYEGKFPQGEKNHFIDADKFAQGTYSVRIASNKRVEVQSLVIM